MNSDNFDVVAAIFERLFGTPADQVTDSVARGDLEGWDSLGHLKLVELLRDEFSAELSAEAALDIETVADVRRVLAGRTIDARFQPQ